MSTLIAAALLLALTGASAAVIISGVIYARVSAAARPEHAYQAAPGTRRPMFESFSALCGACGALSLGTIAVAVTGLILLPALPVPAYLVAGLAGSFLAALGVRQARREIRR